MGLAGNTNIMESYNHHSGKRLSRPPSPTVPQFGGTHRSGRILGLPLLQGGSLPLEMLFQVTQLWECLDKFCCFLGHFHTDSAK